LPSFDSSELGGGSSDEPPTLKHKKTFAVIWRTTLNIKAALAGVLAEIPVGCARRLVQPVVSEQGRAFHAKAPFVIFAGVSSSLVIDLVQSCDFGYPHTSHNFNKFNFNKFGVAALRRSVWPAAGALLSHHASA
jgi:hypothetical protein